MADAVMLPSFIVLHAMSFPGAFQEVSVPVRSVHHSGAGTSSRQVAAPLYWGGPWWQ